MPTYDYLCGKCGHDFEKFQSITARTLRKCPECASMSLKRLIGAGAGIIFKGSGFYQTDYRSESYKNGAENAKTAKSSAKSDKKKDEAKSEKAKPDPKVKAEKKAKNKSS